MPLSIRIISSPSGETVSEWNKQFPEEGGEIGRAYGSTLQLSDASREISGTHAVIKKSPRGYQVMDSSTNGLFINGAPQPLGKGNQTTLSDGDVLNVGQYRLLVSCFVPEQAAISREASLAGTQSVPFSDDPFASSAAADIGEAPVRPAPTFSPNMGGQSFQPSQSSQPQSNGFSADFGFSPSSDLHGDDPFQQAPEPQQKRASSPQDLMKDFTDDPFGDDESGESFPSFTATPEDVFEPVGNNHSSLAEYLTPREHEQQCVEKAMELAFARLLEEMSPDSLEHMFNDLVRPSFFGRKPKYWDMYKRYFQRQVSNRDWQIKFGAYFQESYRLLKMGEK
ncbi:FHA domain protein [Grimontia celer]|uniref:FHA domain protein n=1 Tax=Grimontia celer TaxID=1796497 RepID=A0A128EUL7_9GAMM|nr:FHA domain-containing protein [Grimontia celer]CZF78287.1 FHA domain protein [Grimontia celer]